MKFNFLAYFHSFLKIDVMIYICVFLSFFFLFLKKKRNILIFFKCNLNIYESFKILLFNLFLHFSKKMISRWYISKFFLINMGFWRDEVIHLMLESNLMLPYKMNIVFNRKLSYYYCFNYKLGVFFSKKEKKSTFFFLF